jgi:hypothetical protein
MKYKIARLLFVFNIVMLGMSPVQSNVVHAQNAQMIHSSVNQPYNFTFRLWNENRQIRTQADLDSLLRDLLEYLRELQASLKDGNDEVEVVTRSADHITSDRALLRGEVIDFGDADRVRAWFEYGRTSAALVNRTKKEKLQSDDDQLFDAEVRGLHDDTKYYFRAAALGAPGTIEYGSVMSFTTDDISRTEEPFVTTKNATGVTDDSVVLCGTVDMNDFRNGEVFFVYGENEDYVTEVESEFDTYEAVNEHGKDLQKVLVDSDLDNALTYQLRVIDLLASTSLYFTLCVAYENGDTSLVCGVVRNVATES